MTRLREVIRARPVRVSFDEYVPFSVEFTPTVLSADESFYWRRTDARHLFEVKVAAAGGAVVSATLVLVAPESVSSVPSVSTLARADDIQSGHPVVDLTPWLEKLGHREIGVDPAVRRIDETGPLTFAIADDGVAVVLDPGPAATVVVEDAIRFWFDSDARLCGMALMNVERDVIGMLRESFGR